MSRDCNLREVDLAVPVSVQLIQHDVKLVFCKRHFRSLKIDGFYLRSTIQFKRWNQTSNLYNWISWRPRVAKSTIENKTHAALKPSQHCTIYWLMVFFCCFFFVWGFSSHSRIFHSYGDVTITDEELQILTYARHSWPFSSECSLACGIRTLNLPLAMRTL